MKRGKNLWNVRNPMQMYSSIIDSIDEDVPSNNVQGFGKLRGRPIVFTADDFSIRAGHADGALMAKTVC